MPSVSRRLPDLRHDTYESTLQGPSVRTAHARTRQRDAGCKGCLLGESGRQGAPQHCYSNAGYDRFEVFVDDASGYAVVVPSRTSAARAPRGLSGSRSPSSPSGASRRGSTSGPMPGRIGPMAIGSGRCRASSTSTITGVRTPRSEALCVARPSTAAPNTTPSRYLISWIASASS